MAKTLEVLIPTGITATAKLFTIGSDAVAETIGTLTEATNRLGTATGTVTVTGWHRVIVFSGAVPVGDFVVNVGSDDPATYTAVLDTAIDWNKIQNPTTSVALTGTTVKTATDVETDTQDIQARLPAALAGGFMKSDVLAISGSTAAATILKLLHANLVNGTAQAGGASSITLAAGASAVDGYYDLQAVWIIDGTGAGQTNGIQNGGYNGTTKVATVTTPWDVVPDATSVYAILGRLSG